MLMSFNKDCKAVIALAVLKSSSRESINSLINDSISESVIRVSEISPIKSIFR